MNTGTPLSCLPQMRKKTPRTQTMSTGALLRHMLLQRNAFCVCFNSSAQNHNSINKRPNCANPGSQYADEKLRNADAGITKIKSPRPKEA